MDDRLYPVNGASPEWGDARRLPLVDNTVDAIPALVAGLLRLGFVAQFLSRPVMEGFVFGLAIFVTVSQLPKLFGLEKGSGDTIAQFVHLIGHLGDTIAATRGSDKHARRRPDLPHDRRGGRRRRPGGTRMTGALRRSDFATSRDRTCR